MAPPNDESRYAHRLYEQGLREVLSLGEVKESTCFTAAMVFAPAARHYIVVLKEGTVEVLADELSVERIPGSPHDAASARLTGLA